MKIKTLRNKLTTLVANGLDPDTDVFFVIYGIRRPIKEVSLGHERQTIGQRARELKPRPRVEIF